jgi:maleate isomerase
VSAHDLSGMIAAIAAEKPQAIASLCTNLVAAPLAETPEAQLAMTIYDSVATAVHGALRAIRVDPSRVKGFGRLFASG